MSIRSINKITLIGNIGKDPELRVMQNGTSVTTFSLATTDEWKDKQGETVESTEWHRIVVYGKLAEIAKEYCKKGNQVYIEGQLKVRRWQDENGNEQKTPEIIVNPVNGTVFLLGGSRNNTAATPQNNNTAATPQNNNTAATPQQQPEPPMDFPDDIPF